MRIHSLEHAPHEGAGKIEDWAKLRGYTFTRSALFNGDPLPDIDEVDLLVVMGGAMNVYQHRDFPWLVPEKQFLQRVLARDQAMLGICLGAQLIADALGGKIFQNDEKEIGWFPVDFIDRGWPFDGFPERPTVFHWHGDTFDLPHGARWIARSEGCGNQAYLYGERVVGLQFHIEVTPEAVAGFLVGAENELQPGRFVQTAAQIAAAQVDLTPWDAGLAALLDGLTGSR
jgi:GMP synthase (glutamine-hydrolysing)